MSMRNNVKTVYFTNRFQFPYRLLIVRKHTLLGWPYHSQSLILWSCWIYLVLWPLKAKMLYYCVKKMLCKGKKNTFTPTTWHVSWGIKKKLNARQTQWQMTTIIRFFAFSTDQTQNTFSLNYKSFLFQMCQHCGQNPNLLLSFVWKSQSAVTASFKYIQ